MKFISTKAAFTNLHEDGRKICRDPKAGYTTRDLILWAVATQPAFVKTMSGALAAGRIDRAAREDDEYIALEDDDYKLLLEGLKEPEQGFPIQPPVRIIELLHEVRDATSERPGVSTAE